MNAQFLSGFEYGPAHSHREAGTHPGEVWIFYTNCQLADTETLDRVPNLNWKIVDKAFNSHGKELKDYCSIWRINIGDKLNESNKS